jgi:hypothetical protein
MSVRIQVRRLCAGNYEIHTPNGAYRLDNCPVDTSDPFMKGFRAGPRWMLTYPGRYSADDVFDTKRDAIAYIRTIEEEKATVTEAATTPCPTHKVADERGTHAEALPVPRCEPDTTYGVWDELAGGFTFAVDCAMDAANWAAEQLDEDPDGEMTIKTVCREHEDQPADGCEDCFADY